MAHHLRLLTLEADAIFGFEPANIPSQSSSSSSSSSVSSSDGATHRVLRDPSLHALLIWSAHGVVTALSPAISANLTEHPQHITSQAAASLVDLALFRVQVSSTLAMVPASLVHLQDALGLPARAIAGGPTWIVPDAMRRGGFKGTFPDGVRIRKSTIREDRRAMARVHRPEGWEADEWTQLIRGDESRPWAMAVYHDESSKGEIVCICHTPARNDVVAEAGIWTRKDWRGRGLAASTVAAWATTHGPDTATLFYSTSRENVASQAVARKLGLEEFGYIWKLLVM